MGVQIEKKENNREKKSAREGPDLKKKGKGRVGGSKARGSSSEEGAKRDSHGRSLNHDY